TSQLAALRARTAPNEVPLKVGPDLRAGRDSITLPHVALRVSAATANRFATERIGLILPTSLCSTQIARLAAERLNARQVGRAAGISRFIGFTHTEGCGFGGETMY